MSGRTLTRLTSALFVMAMFSGIFAIAPQAHAVIPAPSNLRGSASSVGVWLAWNDNSDNEDSFSVYRSENGGANFTLIKTVPANTTEYIDGTVVDGKTYVYQVRSVKVGEGGGTSNNFTIFFLKAPVNLKATVSPAGITITWQHNSPYEDSFLVYRRIEGTGTWAGQGQLPANTLSWTDTGVEPGKTYHYYVIAARGGDYSSSTTVTATMPIPPAAPSNLSATAGAQSITLKWTDNSSNETRFVIERRTGLDGPWGQLDSVGANVTTYVDHNVSPGKTYYYRVNAYADGVGYSAYSGEASATMPTPPASTPSPTQPPPTSSTSTPPSAEPTQPSTTQPETKAPTTTPGSEEPSASNPVPTPTPGDTPPPANDPSDVGGLNWMWIMVIALSAAALSGTVALILIARKKTAAARCSGCSVALAPGSSFCPNCGTPVNAANDTVEMQEPNPADPQASAPQPPTIAPPPDDTVIPQVQPDA